MRQTKSLIDEIKGKGETLKETERENQLWNCFFCCFFFLRLFSPPVSGKGTKVALWDPSSPLSHVHTLIHTNEMVPQLPWVPHPTSIIFNPPVKAPPISQHPRRHISSTHPPLLHINNPPIPPSTPSNPPWLIPPPSSLRSLNAVSCRVVSPTHRLDPHFNYEAVSLIIECACVCVSHRFSQSVLPHQ